MNPDRDYEPHSEDEPTDVETQAPGELLRAFAAADATQALDRLLIAGSKWLIARWGPGSPSEPHIPADIDLYDAILDALLAKRVEDAIPPAGSNDASGAPRTLVLAAPDVANHDPLPIKGVVVHVAHGTGRALEWANDAERALRDRQNPFCTCESPSAEGYRCHNCYGLVASREPAVAIPEG